MNVEFMTAKFNLAVEIHEHLLKTSGEGADTLKPKITSVSGNKEFAAKLDVKFASLKSRKLTPAEKAALPEDMHGHPVRSHVMKPLEPEFAHITQGDTEHDLTVPMSEDQFDRFVSYYTNLVAAIANDGRIAYDRTSAVIAATKADTEGDPRTRDLEDELRIAHGLVKPSTKSTTDHKTTADTHKK